MAEKFIDDVVQDHVREMAQHPERMEASSNGKPILDDWNAVIHAMNWLTVLASPRMFHSMNRRPTREHLLKQVDIYVTYVKHDGRYVNADFQPVPYERRGPLAARLHELVAQWTPPELPVEMIQIARELLHAEGQKAPPEGWDKYAGDPHLTFPTEDVLLWPEGVPAVLRAQAEGMEENYIDISKLET